MSYLDEPLCLRITSDNAFGPVALVQLISGGRGLGSFSAERGEMQAIISAFKTAINGVNPEVEIQVPRALTVI